MASTAVYNNDEVLGHIKAKLDTSGEPGCVVKCKRRKAQPLSSGILEYWATFRDVPLEKIAAPEAWLFLLAGGGEHILEVYESKDLTRVIGGMLRFTITGPAKNPIAFDQISRPDWPGPTVLDYPSPQQLAEANAPQPMVVSSSPGSPTTPMGHYAPAMPQAPAMMPGTVQAEVALAGANAALAQKHAENENLRDQLRALQSQVERAQTERAADAKTNVLEHKIAQLAAKLDAPPPAPVVQKSAAEAVTPILGAIAPILQEMVKGQADARREALQMQMKMQEMQIAAQQQFSMVLMKMGERPAIDPAVVALQDKFDRTIEKLRDQDPAATHMMTQMADAMGGMMNMTVGILQTASETGLIGNGKEPVGMMVVKEIAKMVESFGRATSKGIGQRRLVAGPRRPKPQPPRAAQQPKIPETVQLPRAPAVSVASQTESPNIVEPEIEEDPPNPLDEIADMILDQADPEAIADRLVAVWPDPAVRAEIVAYNGSFIEAFQARIDLQWANEHGEYLQELLGVLEERLEDAGIVVSDDGEDDGEVVEGDAK